MWLSDKFKMAMVLSSQSRLLVALCFTVLVLAGALTVGSLAGWFSPVFTEPMPARLQVSHYNGASFCLLKAFKIQKSQWNISLSPKSHILGEIVPINVDLIYILSLNAIVIYLSKLQCFVCVPYSNQVLKILLQDLRFFTSLWQG